MKVSELKEALKILKNKYKDIRITGLKKAELVEQYNKYSFNKVKEPVKKVKKVKEIKEESKKIPVETFIKEAKERRKKKKEEVKEKEEKSIVHNTLTPAEQVMFNPDLLRMIGGMKKNIERIDILKSNIDGLYILMKAWKKFEDAVHPESYHLMFKEYDGNAEYFVNKMDTILEKETLTKENKRFIEDVLDNIFNIIGRNFPEDFNFIIGEGGTIQKGNYYDEENETYSFPGRGEAPYFNEYKYHDIKLAFKNILKGLQEAYKKKEDYNTFEITNKEYHEEYSDGSPQDEDKDPDINYDDIEWFDKYFPKGMVYFNDEITNTIDDEDQDEDEDEYDEDRFQPYVGTLYIVVNL